MPIFVNRASYYVIADHPVCKKILFLWFHYANTLKILPSSFWIFVWI